MHIIPHTTSSPWKRYYDELDTLLHENDITLNIHLVSCLAIDDEYDKCYKNVMDSALYKNKSKAFIKKMHRLADKRYAKNKINRTLSNIEVDRKAHLRGSKKKNWDRDSRYGFIDSLNSKLPNDSDFRFGVNIISHSLVTVKFVIDKSGAAKNCIIIDSSYIFGEGDDTIEQIERTLVKIINGMNIWEPAELSGKAVSMIETQKIPIIWN